MSPLFQALIAEFGKPGAVFSMKQQSVEGEYAYILWTAETADTCTRWARTRSLCGTADRDSVIHRQDYAQELETRLRPCWGYLTHGHERSIAVGNSLNSSLAQRSVTGTTAHRIRSGVPRKGRLRLGHF